MTRYLENRAATMRRLDVELPAAAYEVLEDQSEAGARRRDRPPVAPMPT